VNDRRTDQDAERRRFTSRVLPPYMRRSPKVAEVLPVLYLHGLSTGDFREALAALLGDDAAGLSATNIVRLTNEWETEYRAFQKRRLADRASCRSCAPGSSSWTAPAGGQGHQTESESGVSTLTTLERGTWNVSAMYRRQSSSC